MAHAELPFRVFFGKADVAVIIIDYSFADAVDTLGSKSRQADTFIADPLRIGHGSAGLEGYSSASCSIEKGSWLTNAAQIRLIDLVL